MRPFLILFLVIGCGQDDNGPSGPVYDPVIPSSWATTVTNTYFPLVPGTIWHYSGETEEGTETNDVEVLSETREISGVTATVVHDEVFLEDVLTEETFDWYAEDDDGNVWYLGEDSQEYENGESSSAGSWEWGVEAALPGIIMWADPAAHIGEEYRQEYKAGEAEDFAVVVAVDQTVEVPYGSFTDCVQTDDWNALEGREDSLERKYYCPDLGTMLEVPPDAPGESVELVGLTVP